MKIRPAFVVVCVLLLAGAVTARAQMPDVRQMAGIPMPVGDLQPGTVVVRVVQDEIANVISGQPVELQVGGATMKATTDASGHAQFSGVAAGANVRASTMVGGRRLESQAFAMPATGGIRVVLAAVMAGGGGGAAAPPPSAAPTPGAPPGEVVLGGDSRIQIEFDDDSLTVFYILDFMNGGSTPISPKQDVAFDLPEGAEQPTLLEGSSSQATVRGRHVTVAGPFAPGATPVQIAFGLPPAGSSRTLVQAWPVSWLRVQVIATSLPGLEMISSQFSSSGAVPGDTHNFVQGTGEMLGAGQPITLSLSGLPTRNRSGRLAAIALAMLVLIGGVWATYTSKGRSGDAARRAELLDRRERLMADLVRLERQHRAGAGDAGRYPARREDLISQLERVYGETDRQGALAGEELPA